MTLEGGLIVRWWQGCAGSYAVVINWVPVVSAVGGLRSVHVGDVSWRFGCILLWSGELCLVLFLTFFFANWFWIWGGGERERNSM